MPRLRRGAVFCYIRDASRSAREDIAMASPFQRFVQRVADLDVLDRLLDFLPEEQRHTAAEIRHHVREHGRLPRPELIRGRPVTEGQTVRGAAVVVGDVHEGGSLLGANLLRGHVAGTVRGVNVLIGSVHGGEVRGVNVLLGDVHEGQVRSVNVLVGSVYGGEVRCNVLIGDVHDGRVHTEILIGQEHGGAVEVNERVHVHDHPE
jgi:hypothetical protein